MSIDLGRTEPRRDRWGRYLVLPPEGGKPVGYTRATTIAKALDDQSSLINWRSRMTAIGLAQRADLLALVGINADDKKMLDELCDRAAEHGGATARRDLGTALHGMFEQSVSDPDYRAPAEYAADIAAIHQALEQAGLRIVTGMVERQVVLDDLKIAGTFDLLLKDRHGNLFIGDLKTGATLSYGAAGFALQLALYAHADALYTQGPAKNGSEDRREPMPAVNQQRAVIVHCEPGSGTATVHALDIGAGWDKVETALEVRAWRSRKDILTGWEPANAPTTLAVVTVDHVDNATRAAALRVRGKAALAAWPDGVDEFRRCWPEHVPPLTDLEHDWKRRELDDLEELIAGAEQRLIPLPAIYPEGPIVDRAWAAALNQRRRNLPSAADAALRRINDQAVEVGLIPNVDDQDDRYPLRERDAWRLALLLDVAYLFDPDDIEPVLRACAAYIYPDGTVVNLCRALAAMTTDNLTKVLDLIEHGLVRFDQTVDGDLHVTIG